MTKYRLCERKKCVAVTNEWIHIMNDQTTEVNVRHVVMYSLWLMLDYCVTQSVSFSGEKSKRDSKARNETERKRKRHNSETKWNGKTAWKVKRHASKGRGEIKYTENDIESERDNRKPSLIS